MRPIAGVPGVENGEPGVPYLDLRAQESDRWPPARARDRRAELVLIQGCACAAT
jgi:hypothetical protein